jgi:hypothetical protein
MRKKKVVHEVTRIVQRNISSNVKVRTVRMFLPEDAPNKAFTKTCKLPRVTSLHIAHQTNIREIAAEFGYLGSDVLMEKVFPGIRKTKPWTNDQTKLQTK